MSDPGPFQVRDATAGEYPEVARLTIAAYQEYAADLGDEHWGSYRDDLANVARRAQRGAVVVAETSERLVGAVSYYPPVRERTGEESAWVWWPPRYGYVRALAVHPDFRHMGVGRGLTLACIERAREAGGDGLALNTVAIMKAAQRMYEGLGFRRVPGPEEDPATDDGWGLLSYQLDFASAAPDLVVSRPT
ncbi:MAG TPA: GNAT family N-acetyltransferase [Actinomycetota bacterium]|nr:GNAT family N-acetyltransferase [Actinomycetota bacterium]